MKDKLLNNIVKNAETGCWCWTGQVSNSGYGRIMVSDGRGSNSMQSAHLVSYTVFVGPVSAGMLVRQTCGNRLCINPEHLTLFSPPGKAQWAVTAPAIGSPGEKPSD